MLKGFLTGLGPICKTSREAAVSITPTCLRQKSFMMATGVCHPEYETVYTQWVTLLPDRIEQAGFVRSLGGYRSRCLLHLQSLKKLIFLSGVDIAADYLPKCC